jgi:hypothetical protein
LNLFLFIFFTFASFLIGTKLVAGRALAFGASGQVDTVMRASKVGQHLVGTFVNIDARFVVTGVQGVAGGA